MSLYSIDDQVLSLPFEINHLNLKTTLIILIWLKYTIRVTSILATKRVCHPKSCRQHPRIANNAQSQVEFLNTIDIVMFFPKNVTIDMVWNSWIWTIIKMRKPEGRPFQIFRAGKSDASKRKLMTSSGRDEFLFLVLLNSSM